MRGAAAVALVLAAAGPAAARQAAPPLRVSSAVAPETVTVGDRFRSVLQVVVPEGASVEFSPAAVGDTLQPADSLRVIPGRAGEPPIAAYSLVAWVAGTPLEARVPVRVALADGSAATYLVPLRLPVVRSVLPADTAGLEPRPAHGVLPLPDEPRPWWPWAALAALLLALAAAGSWFHRRRASARPGAELPPRERALAALERIAAGGAAPGAALYPPVTRVLRGYLAEAGARWGADLTTRELLERLREDGVAEEHREPLAALLRHADRVKFARHSPAAGEVERFLVGAREWIRAYPPVEPAGARAREAA